jgi:hypothetical protein
VLQKPIKGSKQTLEKSLRQVYKTTGKKPKQLEALDNLPPEIAYIWLWFLEISGHCPLTYAELESWNRLTCANLRPWEAEAIKSLDRLFWRTIHD